MPDVYVACYGLHFLSGDSEIKMVILYETVVQHLCTMLHGTCFLQQANFILSPTDGTFDIVANICTF